MPSVTVDAATRAAAWHDAQQACATAGIELVGVHDAAGCHETAAVLDRVWGEAQPVDVLVALAHSGNYVALAQRDGRSIGAAMGFFGPPDTPFHSHAVGIVPGAVGGGIGRAVKLHQRAWCLDRGVTAMAWTYDPLIARNSHFNVHRLGARPVSYHRDFYGELSDTINAGQASDRMLLRWDLLTAGPSDAGVPTDEPVHVALAASGDGPGVYRPMPADHTGAVLVEVPRDIEGLRLSDPVVAAAWRAATRAAFTDLLDAGHTVDDFVERTTYLLRPRREGDS